MWVLEGACLNMSHSTCVKANVSVFSPPNAATAWVWRAENTLPESPMLELRTELRPLCLCMLSHLVICLTSIWRSRPVMAGHIRIHNRAANVADVQ